MDATTALSRTALAFGGNELGITVIVYYIFLFSGLPLVLGGVQFLFGSIGGQPYRFPLLDSVWLGPSWIPLGSIVLGVHT